MRLMFINNLSQVCFVEYALFHAAGFVYQLFLPEKYRCARKHFLERERCVFEVCGNKIEFGC